LLTVAALNVSLIELRQEAWLYGGATDGQKLLQAALAAYQRHPSSAGRSALKSAYFFLGSEQLSRQNQEFAALAAHSRHAVSPGDLFAFILERGGPLAEAARRNENVIQAMALAKRDVSDFPSSLDAGDWALLRASAPDVAAVMETNLRKDEVTRLVGELQYELNPLNAAIVLRQYWTHKLMGDEKRGREIYLAALQAGVPLPAL